MRGQRYRLGVDESGCGDTTTLSRVFNLIFVKRNKGHTTLTVCRCLVAWHSSRLGTVFNSLFALLETIGQFGVVCLLSTGHSDGDCSGDRVDSIAGTGLLACLGVLDAVDFGDSSNGSFVCFAFCAVAIRGIGLVNE